jgi:hypothetical protein
MGSPQWTVSWTVEACFRSANPRHANCEEAERLDRKGPGELISRLGPVGVVHGILSSSRLIPPRCIAARTVQKAEIEHALFARPRGPQRL